MCGRFDTSNLTWAEIYAGLSTYLEVRSAPQNIEPNDDVRPTTPQLVAHVEDGQFVVEKMRWGLVPYWRGGKPIKDTEKGADDGFKLTTFNCRGETAATSAVFKAAYAKRRCLIPANAWYEWTGEKGSKTKHTFRRADGGLIWFGGMWDRCETSDQGLVSSFTILTQESGGWLTDYHTRAPLVVERAHWPDWLGSSPPVADVRPERFALHQVA